jgi:carbamoyl-phosphate synthase large subunit
MITAGGTVTAQSLLKALREDGRLEFVAAGDMDRVCATKAFVDEFVLLPHADDPAFGTRCLEAARRLRIGLFVPLIVEREFLPLDQLRDAFASIGCHLLVPPRKIVLRTADKLEFARFLEEIGVPGPRTMAYEPAMRVDRFPIYLKPRHGSGSIGTARIASAHSLHEAARERSDLIVQEAVDGTEFTVDCFAAAPGRVVAAVPRERIAIKAGVSAHRTHRARRRRTQRIARARERARDAARRRQFLDHRNEPALFRHARAHNRGGYQLRIYDDRHG